MTWCLGPGKRHCCSGPSGPVPGQSVTLRHHALGIYKEGSGGNLGSRRHPAKESVIDSCRVAVFQRHLGNIAGECTLLCSMPKISSKTIQVDRFISRTGPKFGFLDQLKLIRRTT
eukprot:s1958_g12.t1